MRLVSSHVSNVPHNQSRKYTSVRAALVVSSPDVTIPSSPSCDSLCWQRLITKSFVISLLLIFNSLPPTILVNTPFKFIFSWLSFIFPEIHQYSLIGQLIMFTDISVILLFDISYQILILFTYYLQLIIYLYFSGFNSTISL